MAEPRANFRSQEDLRELFAPPTASELLAVRADWATRGPVVEGYRVDASAPDGKGIRFDIVSHVVEGNRHYGALRYPRNYVPGQPYPTVVVCHGGLGGVSVEEITNFLDSLPGVCVDDDYFVLIPSFRGEMLGTQFIGSWQSEGQPSWADRDVDDTMSLLSSVHQHIPDMDQARVAAWGISRGAAVALLFAQRDPRVRRVVDLFGFTDLSLPSVQAEVDLVVNHGAQPLGIGRVMYESSVEGWLSGALSTNEARQAWIRRSPCYFASSLPSLQIHHGLQDVQVDISHSQALIGAFFALGAGAPPLQVFYYPNGSHGINSLSGVGDRVEPFLCELSAGISGYCGPMTEHFDGMIAAADYRGTCSVSRNDFIFRVNNCRRSSVGLVFVSSTPAYAPASAGFLCVGLGAQRLGVAPVSAQGVFELPVNLASPRADVAPFLTPGSVAYMQLVFRDNGNPMGPINFSNGLRVTVEP